ncbi:MAG: 2-hydroxyacyl-CoA dehydratase family protein [Lachnotalea sp.]
MEVVKKYGEHIKKNIDDNPKKALNMIKLGLDLEKIRIKAKPEKGLPKAYQKLNSMAVKSTLKALQHPEKTVWTNIFSPVEILQCFGLEPLSLECFSSFISGFHCEDYFMDYAENEGIASTLCSYHKNFLGAADSGLLSKPAYALTTSMVCDGNINTFRYLSEKYDVPTYMLDIPNEYSKDAEEYVVTQLKELISLLETKFQTKLDINQLKDIIERENQSKRYYMEFLQEQNKRYYPNTLTINLFMLFATHLNIGSKEALDFFEFLLEDVKKYPRGKGMGKSIFWVHLFPYYQDTLKSYFNINEDYQIKACDINLDYLEEMDVEHPLNALAKKMICNLYNGSYEKKSNMISDIVQKLNIDAVIHFSHWGCKQSLGGVMLLKEEMQKNNIPMLIMDGDGMDRRNSPDGQMKTRLEAFLEMIQKEEGEKDDRICV